MNKRPEIKVYPMEFYPNQHGGGTRGDQTAHAYSRQERNGRSHDEDRYLRGLVGKSVTVHTVSSGELRGVVEAVLSDAIILRTAGGQLFIHDWAIAAILSE